MISTPMFWSLRFHWHDGRLRQLTMLAATVFSAAACLVVGMSLRSALREEAAMQQQLASRAALPRPHAEAASPEKRDFTANLGGAQPADRLVHVVQAAAARAGVTLTSLQVQEYAATPERLGRTELPLVLQGPYPAIKRCLIEVLDRVPSATVARLQWQRSEGSADTETRVQLVVWSAPATAAAASAVRP